MASLPREKYWTSTFLRFRGRLGDVLATIIARIGTAIRVGGVENVDVQFCHPVLPFLGFTAGFIYPAFCALMSENAEEISPFAVARAFGIMNIIAQLGIFVLNLVVPWVRENYGWQAWMFTSGLLCIGIAIAVGFGRGPWLDRYAR